MDEFHNQNPSEEPVLFPIPEQEKIKTDWIPKKPMRYPIWTENKAALIEQYLRLFVYITHHGTYIDGFAGPQKPDEANMWAAKLVMESQPKWFRHFFLYDIKQQQVSHLEGLKKLQPERDIQIFSGDFNVLIHDLLSSQCIKQKEATFCLLDQRTFECHWSTLKILADYKKDGNNKIELFYFLPNHWLDRALSAQQDDEKLRAWWGRDDWDGLRNMQRYERVMSFVHRIEEEFGYRSVYPWPIYERQDSGHIMYYMIHATDHFEAPKLMFRAYHKAIQAREQLSLWPLDDLQRVS